MEEPKNKGGRPRKADNERLVQRSLRMLPEQWQKFDAAGGHEWLRPTVDALPLPRAKRTKPPAP